MRAVVRAVLDSPAERLRRGFTAREWTAEGFAGAWARARRYFPDKTYYVRPGTYFMTHGFGADGGMFMEIHDSDYLELCARNARAFTAGAVVGDYGRMREAPDRGREAAFREKTGLLEPFFRDEAAHRRLRDALGEGLHRRLLDGLREENFHMLAGGLVHEGIHAGVDDATVARLRADFGQGRLPVQWDELRAFMAEAAFHARFGRWAAGEIAESARRIEGALGELEALRRAPRLRPGRDRDKYEGSRASAGAFAALVRLRMREIWQSALRLKALVEGFRKDYLRGDPPAQMSGLFISLERGAAAHAEASGRASQRTELALRELEATLRLWSEWAEGGRPFPPPVTASAAAVKGLAGVAWPDPPAEGCLALKRLAESEIGRPAGPR